MAIHQFNAQGGNWRRSTRSGIGSGSEAEDIVRREPELASFIYSTVLHHERLEESVVHRHRRTA